MRLAREEADVPHVGVERCDVPVADECDLRRRVARVARDPGRSLGPEPVEPGELVLVVRIVELAAVGYVQAPHPDPGARRPERAGLDHRLGTVPRLPREGGLDVGQAHPGDDRDAVPLREAEGGDLVPGRLEDPPWELLVLALGLLQREHVRAGAFQEGNGTVCPRADRVDVPGRQPHADQASGHLPPHGGP